jgi:hypothetical protein
MIARIWHGWTKRADAKAYEEMLRDEIFPSIAARKINGYRGAELFIHEDDDEIEFITPPLRLHGCGERIRRRGHEQAGNFSES